MHFEAMIVRTSRQESIESEVTLGGGDQVKSEDALGGRGQASLAMHSVAVTERVWRCTCSL